MFETCNPAAGKMPRQTLGLQHKSIRITMRRRNWRYSPFTPHYIVTQLKNFWFSHRPRLPSRNQSHYHTRIPCSIRPQTCNLTREMMFPSVSTSRICSVRLSRTFQACNLVGSSCHSHCRMGLFADLAINLNVLRQCIRLTSGSIHKFPISQNPAYGFAVSWNWKNGSCMRSITEALPRTCGAGQRGLSGFVPRF